MVVRIQLTIKHIRGHTFPVDADVDSDVLGLKVQIWESQKIAIENQRLVFGGKELQDNLKLSELGVGDNAMIFLVESNAQIPQQPQAEVPPVTIEMPIQSQVDAPPCTTQVPVTNCQPCQVTNIKCPFRQAVHYEPIVDESVLSDERIDGVVNLAYWVRRYCILGMILSGISLFGCLFSLIPFFMFFLGFFGTRKLNRCLLVFPLLITILLGFCLFVGTIYNLIANYSPYDFLLLIVAILHIMIFSCICKLMCRISKLSCQEWWQARLQIKSRSCCC